MDRFNRRRFLTCAAAGGLAYAFGRTPQAVSATAFSSSAAFADYKALVCVFLFGGNDSFNMVVPRSAAEYGVYATSRQNLAIAQASLLPINSLAPDPNGALHGLHPSDEPACDAVRAGPGVRHRCERRAADRADDEGAVSGEGHAPAAAAVLAQRPAGPVACSQGRGDAEIRLGRAHRRRADCAGRSDAARPIARGQPVAVRTDAVPGWRVLGSVHDGTDRPRALLRPRRRRRVHARTTRGIREHPARQSCRPCTSAPMRACSSARCKAQRESTMRSRPCAARMRRRSPRCFRARRSDNSCRQLRS